MNGNEEFAKAFENAVNDEAFLAKLCSVGSKDEIVKLLADEKGIVISDAEASAAFDKLESLRNGEELTEEDLEYASGGARFGRSIMPRSTVRSGGGILDFSGFGPNGAWGIHLIVNGWLRR